MNHRKASVTKESGESGGLTQVVGIDCYRDKSLITFDANRRFRLKGTKINFYLNTIRPSHEDSQNVFKVFLHFRQVFSPHRLCKG